MSSLLLSDLISAGADIPAHLHDIIALAPASGAVRVDLVTGVPVLASPILWLADPQEQAHQPVDLIDSVQRLFEDDPLRERLSASAREFCHESLVSELQRAGGPSGEA